ncbi:MAG: helix-turn-helix domain-containing protein [Thermoproteota archaeon]
MKDDELLDSLFESLSHEVRRRLLELIVKEGPLSYTAILTKTDLKPGTLNYHLEKMKLLLEIEGGLYRASEQGLKAYNILKSFQGLKPAGIRFNPLSFLDFLIRPSLAFKLVAKGSIIHIFSSIMIGVLSVLISLYAGVNGLQLFLNLSLPIIWVVLTGRYLYKGKNVLGTVICYPTTFQPLIVSSLITLFKPYLIVMELLKAEYLLFITDVILPKIFFAWFFILLLLLAKETLGLNASQAFVCCAFSIAISNVLLDALEAKMFLVG